MGVLRVDFSDMDQLHGFAARLESEPDLAAALRACDSPEAILALAERHGCSFSRHALRAESTNLSAAHWPWAGKGTAWRRRFFAAAAAPAEPQGNARRGWRFGKSSACA